MNESTSQVLLLPQTSDSFRFVTVRFLYSEGLQNKMGCICNQQKAAALLQSDCGHADYFSVVGFREQSPVL